MCSRRSGVIWRLPCCCRSGSISDFGREASVAPPHPPRPSLLGCGSDGCGWELVPYKFPTGRSLSYRCSACPHPENGRPSQGWRCTVTAPCLGGPRGQMQRPPDLTRKPRPLLRELRRRWGQEEEGATTHRCTGAWEAGGAGGQWVQSLSPVSRGRSCGAAAARSGGSEAAACGEGPAGQTRGLVPTKGGLLVPNRGIRVSVCLSVLVPARCRVSGFSWSNLVEATRLGKRCVRDLPRSPPGGPLAPCAPSSRYGGAGGPSLLHPVSLRGLFWVQDSLE